MPSGTAHQSPFSLRRAAGYAARHLALAFVLWLATGEAQADDYGDVQRMIREGRLAQAQQRVDRYLLAHPRDPQWRFAKGVIQRESGRLNEAIATFTRLAEDHPQLPEPYNNLAVIYAAQGQYDKAREALEKALRTHPAYSTAYDNLTELYTRQAAQAYSKALQIEASLPAQPQLVLLQQLHPVAPAAPVVMAHDHAPHAPAIPTPSAAFAPAASMASAAPSTTTATSTPQRPAPPVATPASTPTQPPAAATHARSAVEQAVRAWARAWSERDVARYLSAYSPQFVTPGKLSRRAWEEERRTRILNKRHIQVTLLDLQISVDGDRAVAKFRQDYKADSLAVQSRKTLELARSGERWLIVRESSGG